MIKCHIVQHYRHDNPSLAFGSGHAILRCDVHQMDLDHNGKEGVCVIGRIEEATEDGVHRIADATAVARRVIEAATEIALAKIRQGSRHEEYFTD